MLTLTAPHVRKHSIGERIGLVRGAWSHFLKHMNAWFREHGDAQEFGDLVHWHRTFEWTPGKADRLGHPHIHVWLFCPFLPRELVASWWADALERAGHERADVARVIIDLRVVRGDGEGIANEVIKYLTKDIIAGGAKVAPDIFAEVYKALDGARATQGSRGFIKLAAAGRKSRDFCECGEAACVRIHVLPSVLPEEDDSERAPRSRDAPSRARLRSREVA